MQYIWCTIYYLFFLQSKRKSLSFLVRDVQDQSYFSVTDPRHVRLYSKCTSSNCLFFQPAFKPFLKKQLFKLFHEFFSCYVFISCGKTALKWFPTFYWKFQSFSVCRHQIFKCVYLILK